MSQASPRGAGPTDAALLERFRGGDASALDELVARHHEAAFRLAFAILGSESDAADAAQEGMLRALRGLERFRGEAAFRTWLLSIVANEAKSFLRRTARRREAPLLEDLPEAGGTAADAVAVQAEAARARALLARLPEKQRLAVQLRIDEGLSFREVGEVIGSTEGAARVNYHHGIRRLREWLDE